MDCIKEGNGWIRAKGVQKGVHGQSAPSGSGTISVYGEPASSRYLTVRGVGRWPPVATGG